MAKRVTKEIFIERAKLHHGDKFDYSKVDFVNTKTKICIICPKHGEFWQIPETHMKGTGCPKCSVEQRKLQFTGKSNKYSSIEEKIQKFLQKAKEIHGDKYDYSKVLFKNFRDKIEIICSKHGSFFQSAHHHLQGLGCPKCADENRSNSYKLTTELFIEKAREIHGDKYDYSLVTNPKFGDKITIICPIHGKFNQYTNNHLQDCGCPECSKHYHYDTAEFIRRAKEVHKDVYDYSKTVYINARMKVIITCPIHGDFEQSPSSHLNGANCPLCNFSKGEKLVAKILSNLNYEVIKLKRLCIDNKIVIVDFYLELNNNKYIIEYNGKQHYEPIEYFGGEEQFKKQQLRDSLLRKYCELYNINLLEIAYNISTENIEGIIINFLNDALNNKNN